MISEEKLSARNGSSRLPWQPSLVRPKQPISSSVDSECKILDYVFVEYVFSQFGGVLDQTEPIYHVLLELAEEKDEA